MTRDVLKSGEEREKTFFLGEMVMYRGLTLSFISLIYCFLLQDASAKEGEKRVDGSRLRFSSLFVAFQVTAGGSSEQYLNMKIRG